MDILKILDVQKQRFRKLFDILLKILCSKDCISTDLNKATDSGIMDAKMGPRAIQLKNFGGNSLVVNPGDSGFNPLLGN